MAETVYLENVAKVQLFYGDDLHDIGINTFYLYSTGFAGASAETLSECAALVYTLWKDNVMPSVSAFVNCFECTVADWGSAEGLTGSALGSGPGGMEGAALSAQCATLVNLAQPLRYRGGHPRWYIPYPAQSALQTPLAYTTEFLETFQTALNALFAGLNSLGEPTPEAELICFHTRDHVDHVLQPPSYQTISALTAEGIPATIRRRLRRAGHRR